MSNDKLFEKEQPKKLISVNITEDTIERLNELVKEKKRGGFKVNKSVLVERAINHFLDELERNDTGLFGGI